MKYKVSWNYDAEKTFKFSDSVMAGSVAEAEEKIMEVLGEAAKPYQRLLKQGHGTMLEKWGGNRGIAEIAAWDKKYPPVEELFHQRGGALAWDEQEETGRRASSALEAEFGPMGDDGEYKV